MNPWFWVIRFPFYQWMPRTALTPLLLMDDRKCFEKVRRMRWPGRSVLMSETVAILSSSEAGSMALSNCFTTSSSRDLVAIRPQCPPSSLTGSEVRVTIASRIGLVFGKVATLPQAKTTP